MLPTIATGNVASALPSGYDVDNSCRFNFAASPKLTRTNSSDGSLTNWTFSIWIKRCSLGSTMRLLHCRNSGGTQSASIYISGGNQLNFYATDGTNVDQIGTNRLFRDVSAWYNIVVVWDSDNGTVGNRMRFFINGTEETSLATDNTPATDQESMMSKGTAASTIGLGYASVSDDDYCDMYFAEAVFLDGTAVTDATDFGEFDSDSPTIWKPKDVSGLTFGSHGWYLDFAAGGDLGDDESGNGNDFTEANLAAINQTTDTPTNNFALMNVMNYSPSTNFTNTTTTYGLQEGSLYFYQIAGVNSQRRWVSTVGVTSGKWYFEAICTAGETGACVGISDQSQFAGYGNNYIGELSLDVGYNLSVGSVSVSGSTVDTSEATFGTSDIICVALDATNGKIYFRKNSDSWVNSGDPAGDSNGYAIVAGATYHPSGSININGGIMRVNFGNPIVANSSSVADANGYGAFEYTPPSGFLALCTKNLGSDGG